MTPMLYAHPFSSYCQKVLIALYEKGIAFHYRVLGPDDPDAGRELAELWPLKRFPVLVDDGRTLIEASIIIEHLDRAHPGAVPLFPADPATALDVRMMDRVFDNYVMTPMQKLVLNAIRPEADRDPYGVTEARAMLDTILWLARPHAGGPDLGCGRNLQSRRLRRRAVAVLCRLGARDRRPPRAPAGLPRPAAGAPVGGPRSRRGAPVPTLLPPRRTRPRLTRS